MLILCFLSLVCGLILTLFGWLNLGSLALFTAIGCAGLRKPTQAIEEKASYYLAALLLLWAGLLLTDLYPSSFLSSKQGLWENFQAGALGGTFLIYSWTLWKIGSSRPLVPGLLLLIVLFGFLEETSWGTDWLSAKQSQTFSVHEAQWTPSIVDSFFAIGIPFSLLVYGVVLPLCAFLWPSVRYLMDQLLLPVGPLGFSLIVPLILSTINGWDASEIHETTLYSLLLFSTIYSSQRWCKR